MGFVGYAIVICGDGLDDCCYDYNFSEAIKSPTPPTKHKPITAVLG